MEQYQAQVVSALRSSLGARQAAAGGLPGFSNAGANAAAAATAAAGGGGGGPAALAGTVADPVQHPLLQIAGGVLATTFLESGLAAGARVHWCPRALACTLVVQSCTHASPCSHNHTDTHVSPTTLGLSPQATRW